MSTRTTPGLVAIYWDTQDNRYAAGPLPYASRNDIPAEPSGSRFELVTVVEVNQGVKSMKEIARMRAQMEN